MTLEKLLDILRGIHPEIDFETCATLIDDSVLDSFDIVTIIAEVNEHFDIAITANEIIPENFNSAQALYALIERLAD